MSARELTASLAGAGRASVDRVVLSGNGSDGVALRRLRAVAERDRLALGLACGWAIACGALVGISPKLAEVVLAGGVVLALGLFAPVTVLLALLTLTAVVPYELQHPLAIGATETSPGLLPSDALLGAAMLRAVLLLPQTPIGRPAAFAAGLILVFVAVCTVQIVHGLGLGANLSVVGGEFRHLVGFATLLPVLTILGDERSRRRLFGGMLVLGVLLGVWGIAQWTLKLDFGFAGDLGVRQGVALTTNGVGQLQGGLFIYPVAVLLSLGVLAAGTIRRGPVRLALIATFVLNCVDLLLTYERTFWLATLVGAAIILARAGARARRRALAWAPLALALLVVAVVLSPATFATAEERLLSVGQYGKDSSVQYRVIESRHVLARIQAHPLTGSGLGATIFWGRPNEGVPDKEYNYSHDGYLWLSWKIGIPGAALLVLLMVVAALWRGSPEADPTYAALRRGCQAALVTLLIVSITFPVFNSLPITCLAGVLIGIAAVPAPGAGRRGAWPVRARP
jgi:O-antigen ligase